MELILLTGTYFLPQVLNYWHPSEKARYPTYFARREKRVLAEQTRWEELVEEEKQLLGQGANQNKPQAS